MAKIRDMVRVIKGVHIGKIGRLIDIYSARDGITLQILTPAGEILIDMPAGIDSAKYLEVLPKKGKH